MSSTMAVADLRVGIYIQLDGGWLSHPFPLSSFRIASEDQIHTLRGLGLRQVRWVPEKSDLPEAPGEGADAVQPVAGMATPGAGNGKANQIATPLKPASATDPAHSRHQQALQVQTEAARLCERQHGEATTAWRGATEAMVKRPREAGRITEQLTRAILVKMLVGEDIGIRLVTSGCDRAASHALNVGVISLLIARALSLSEAELLDLGVGALMHDIGKTELPEGLRHLEEGFTDGAINAYREHVAKGVTLAQRMSLSAGAMRVVAQHHELADGSGFPLKLAGERLTMAARVVALVNRYDNLCNPQTHTLALTPHEAVSVLFAQGRQRYDTAVLNAFIRIMGVYPAGSLVQLTDDRYAMVIGVNASRPLKPRVLVHESGVPRGEALLLDLEQHSDVGIRRSLPAAKLPPAVIDYLDPRPRVAYYFEPLALPVTEEMAA